MKNLLIALICCCGFFPLSAQFNTLFDSGPYEQVVYEVSTDCSATDGLAAGLRFDFNGNPNLDQLIVGSFDKSTGVVNNPAFTYPNSSTAISYFRIEDNVEMEAIKDMNGICIGYLIIISVQQSAGGEFDLNIIRLDANGNLLSSLTLYENNNASEYCNEIIQDSDGQMVFTGQINDAQGNDILIGKFDINTFSIDEKRYPFDVFGDGAPDTSKGFDIIEVSGTNTTAKYAVVGQAESLSLLMLVENNFNYVDHQLFDLDSDPTIAEHATAVQFDGSNFLVTGERNGPLESTFVFSVNGVAGISPLFAWNWGNYFSIPGAEIYPTDMELSNTSNTVVISGVSNLGTPLPGNVNSDSYLMEVSAGTVNWAYNHNFSNHEGALLDLEKEGNNFFMAGVGWEDPTSVVPKLQIVSTDLNGEGNSGCYEDLNIEVLGIMPTTYHFPPQTQGILSPLGELLYTFFGIDTPQENCEDCPEEPDYIHFDITTEIQTDTSVELGDYASDVIQDPDGNYLFTGITELQTTGEIKPYLVKLDPLGNVILGPIYFDLPGLSLAYTDNPTVQIAYSATGGFIGYSVLINISAIGYKGILVSGFNPDLSKNCSFELSSGAGGDWLYTDFVQNGNSLYIVGKAVAGTSSDMLVLKSIVPFNCPSGGGGPFPSPANYSVRLYPSIDEATSICNFADGTMGVAGNVNADVCYANLLPNLNLASFGPLSGNTNHIVFDVNQDLDMDATNSIAERSDGRVVIGGSQNFTDAIFLIECDRNPVINNSTVTIINTAYPNASLGDMEIKPDGNIVLVGQTQIASNDGRAYISVLDPSYNELSYSEYGDPNMITIGGAFDICNDNGLIIAQLSKKPGCVGACPEQFDSKFTKTGPLGYLVDCECYTPSSLNIVTNNQPGSLFLQASTSIGLGFHIDKNITCQNLELTEDICVQGEGNPMMCDIQTTAQLQQNDSCCVTSLSLVNNMTGVYKIQVDLINPATLQFDWTQTDPAFCIQPGSLSAGSIIIEMCNNGPIPMGSSPDYLEFCMIDSVNTSSLQDFKVTYLNANCSPIPDCMDLLQTECPIMPDIDLDCYEIVMDTVICDTIPGLYDICFTIKNNDPTHSLKWLDLSASNILFLGGNSICISPSIPPGGVSGQICTQIYDNSGLSLPRTIKIDHAAHDSLYNYCCQDLDSLCVVLPNCCDPCESDWVTLDSTGMGVDSCCFALDILVECPLSLTKIITESLTPGVLFGSVYVGGPCAPGWNINSFNANAATFTPVGNSAPVGLCNNLINFCLNDTLGTSPVQQVAIHYITTDLFGLETITCSDTLEFNCNMNVECLEITQDSVYCDSNGDYFLDFCVKNIAFPTFTADKLVLNKISSTPPFLGILPTTFTGISIPPTSTFCGTVQISGVPGLAPFPGQKIVLGFAMHETNAIGQDTCCLDTEELCVVLPPCSDCCEDFQLFCNSVQPNTVIYGICDSAFVSIAYADSCTYADIDWGDGTTEAHVGSFSTSHNYNIPGTYTVCADYKESSDGGQTFCWNKLVCDTVTVEICPSDFTICDSIEFDTTSYLGWAAATCWSSGTGAGYVCGVMDVRNHEQAPVGNNWGPPYVTGGGAIPPPLVVAPKPTMYHGTGANQWNRNNLGEVFGLAVDPSGNIYTSAFSMYYSENYGPTGVPSIYKLNPYTSAITNLGSLPQSPDPAYANQMPGYGNVCYNFKNHLVYVSNLEDGKIYVLDANTGAQTGTAFDHAFPDNGAAGFAPLGERIFGVGYNHVENRVYYGVWNLDMTTGPIAGVYNEIWSIGLNQNGTFSGPATYEFALPYLATAAYSNPPADISFDATGTKMLVAEKTIGPNRFNNSKLGAEAHRARNLEYYAGSLPPFSTTYVAQNPNKYQSTNATGGNDYAYADSALMVCDSFVVMMEDALFNVTSSPVYRLYGVRGVSNTGGNKFQSWMVDLDEELSDWDKNELGDVEIFRNLCCVVPQVDSCDFTFSSICTDLTLFGMPSGGTPPFTYDWDIDCDGTVDISGQNPTWTFPSVPPTSTHCIKMIVTDATGASCEVQKQVTVQDTVPPALNCPGNITLNTDPGLCIATYMLPGVTDDCDQNPTISCQVSGATTGDETTTQFNLGVTTITCTAVDASGNTSTCTFTITVVDVEPPVITCPANITIVIPGCDGSTPVNFPAPVFSDNCPIVNYVCTHQSGDIFNCGITTVTCTATDNAGNMSTCSFTVNVVCECAELVNSSIACNPIDENVQDFSITLNSLTGLSNPGQFCTASVSTNQTGVTLSNITTTWSGLQVTITGSATITACPDQLNLIANLNCICPNAPAIVCDIPVTLATVCCKTVSISSTDICRDGPSVSIPLIGCDSLCDVQQVKWYVADAPCPPTSWGAPFQITNSCLPLLIDPQFHNGDICIYAEVIIGPNGGPCQPILYSDTATITLCASVDCAVSASQTYCYTGTPITPTLLTGTISTATPNCPYTVQWFDGNTLIPGETQLTYQPPALSIPTGSTACSVSTTYTMKVTSECGVSECSATIRLDNEDAPLGLLEMDPLEPTPFCPGEDATMRYTPACAGSPATWDWLISNDGISFTNITTAGNQNPLYNTNRLYQDTWYRIEKQNGSCPVDTIDDFIPVNGALVINSFTAVHAPICAATSVDMTIDFGPIYPSPCDYTITWYRNGQVINVTPAATASPASYTYTPASTDDIAGNYYAVVSNNCCNESLKSSVVVVDPPCEVIVLGPCFRCNVDTITLSGSIINPIAGAICTYQWYDENGIISGATNDTLVVGPSQAGPFVFEVTCTLGADICTKSDTFDLKQCGKNDFIIAIEELATIDFSIYPNPTSGQLFMVFEEPITYEGILLYDATGKLIKGYRNDFLVSEKTLDISNFPPGIYLVKIVLDSGHSITRRVVKQ